ncbi:MAG: CHASE2 domain-containing protein [Phormidesmis sp.]
MPKPQNAHSTQSRSAKAQSIEDVTATLTTKDRLTFWQQSVVTKHWRIALSGALTAIAAAGVGLNVGLVNLFERQVQSLFFELRGPVDAPENIVILAIDEDSLSQGKYYSEDPARYESLRTIESWPWQRTAYAKVIERLMEAGAATVAIDVVFPQASQYGEADDAALTQVIERYGGRVVLAGKYEDVILPQGAYRISTMPLPQFEDAGAQIGIINFLKEPNQQIHRLGQEFVRSIEAADAELLSASSASDSSANPNQSNPSSASATILEEQTLTELSFAQAALKASGRSLNEMPQENIFFYGPADTFQKLPFWKVLDNDPWEKELDNGRFFEGKTVIIGGTASQLQDFHRAPFSESTLYPRSMPGVEILANAIATLQNNRAPKRLIKQPAANALLVLALGLIVAGAMSRTQKPLNRLLVTSGGLGLWTLASYGVFVWGSTIILTGVPIAMLTSMGLLDFGVGFAADRLKRKRLRRTLARYATSPLVQEIISQQDDFQDLLDVNRADLIGTLLRGRYKISKILGAGGFGETYLAQDTLRPGNPVCVVKQLKIVSDNPKAHRLARRLFESEAVVLGQLGEHHQIPRLLAYFEVQESFYLVQEMIEGKLLREFLSQSRPLSQRAVVRLLLDLLPVVSFVHSKGVIHRDIKPSNIIRRAEDKRYVLIDFGAVKTISNKLADVGGTQITSTVGIGTQGYMPSEQSAGMPSVRSDIYALGITAIEALTGRPPHALKRSEDGEIIWSHTISNLSPALSSIINKMVRYDFNKRYESAQSVIEALEKLDSSQLTDESSVSNQNFKQTSDTTYNQGTRPGVIETNPELDATAILPTDWPNELPTATDEESSASPSDS